MTATAPDSRHDAEVIPLRPQAASSSARSTRVDQTLRQHLREVIVAAVIVGAIALVDVILIKTTWNQVLLEREIVSWLLAVLTALGGAALMWNSGSLTATTRIHPDPVRVAGSAATAAAWALMGAGLFWLRWNAAAISGAPVAVEGQVVDTSELDSHRLLAVVLIALYVMPGVLAWVDGYVLGNPVAAHQRRTYAELGHLFPLVADIEGETVKVARLVALHHDEIEQVPEQSATARAANAALAAELRALARDEMVRRIGDPAVGGMTHPAEQTAPPADGTP